MSKANEMARRAHSEAKERIASRKVLDKQAQDIRVVEVATVPEEILDQDDDMSDMDHIAKFSDGAVLYGGEKGGVLIKPDGQKIETWREKLPSPYDTYNENMGDNYRDMTPEEVQQFKNKMGL